MLKVTQQFHGSQSRASPPAQALRHLGRRAGCHSRVVPASCPSYLCHTQAQGCGCSVKSHCVFEDVTNSQVLWDTRKAIRRRHLVSSGPHTSPCAQRSLQPRPQRPPFMAHGLHLAAILLAAEAVTAAWAGMEAGTLIQTGVGADWTLPSVSQAQAARACPVILQRPHVSRVQ